MRIRGLETKRNGTELSAVIADVQELKFLDGGDDGVFEGYAAVFGNVDSHGDVIEPGAFRDTLAAHKAAGTMPIMYVQHGPALGGDILPAGVWLEMAEDDKGLRVKGRVSALDTDYGKRVRSLIKDKALPHMSIGYKTRKATYGQKAGEPKRRLKAVDLIEVSPVAYGSNALAQIDGIKANGWESPDTDAAASSIASAIKLHDKRMASSNYGYDSSAKDSAVLMDHMREAHYHLTGNRTPDGLDGWTKSANTIRELETRLRDECRLSHSEAKAVAGLLLKSAPRDEDGTVSGEDDAALASAVSGFSLPKFS